MTEQRLVQYITASELLVRLGQEPNPANRRRLVRRIRARERALGRQLLIQDDPGARGSVVRTTMALVRDALPELFRRDLELAEHIQARLESLEEYERETRARINAVAARLRDHMAEGHAGA